MTNPFPGPVMVTFDPPNIEATTPPTTAAMIPEMGGASLAKAKPSPKGRAISDTTKPRKNILGKCGNKILGAVGFCCHCLSSNYQKVGW